MPRPAVAPQNEDEKARFNLVLPGAAKRRLMELQREVGAANVADLISRAVALYDLVIRETRGQPTRELVVIDRKDYDRRPVGRRVTVL